MKNLLAVMSLIIQVRVVVEDDELVVDALKKEIKHKKIISACL